ncbi:forkhead box protein E4-like [Anneissia japonica]|uniref:forkhead box protein E4-like n=1 Tax=Anneissia japonica TaxID=1529436 RepID=UPI00142571A7|nr:forkhead box protein E4-like [Anneissia japonica]
MAGVLNNMNVVASPDSTVHEAVPDSVSVKLVEPQDSDDVKCVTKGIKIESPTEAPKVNKRKRPRPDYMRRVKSPFSYIEMITFAIVSNPNTMMTLQNITNFMPKAFYCLRGGYEGWKNSVRHTLSINDCFKKVPRHPDRPSGKDNFWIMNEDCKHCKGMGKGWVDLKLRYQKYVRELMVGSSGVQITSQPNVRFDNNHQNTRSPQAAVSLVYHQVEYNPSVYLMPNVTKYPVDLSTTTHRPSRKRPSLDNEPLDLSVKKFKPSPSTCATTGHVRSPNGSCSPMRSPLSIPEHCLFRTRLLNNIMARRMYECDQDGQIKLVQSIDDARRPIYIL